MHACRHAALKAPGCARRSVQELMLHSKLQCMLQCSWFGCGRNEVTAPSLQVVESMPAERLPGRGTSFSRQCWV